MENQENEQLEWRASILTFVVLLAILGLEQFLPISDTLRSQIGVLTVLLMYGFWHLACGLLARLHRKVR